MDDMTLATKAMLEAAIEARMPTMLVGAPGTGKSATIKALARERGYELVTLVGSRMDPTDVVGLPKGEQYGEDEQGKPIFATVNLSPWWQVEILTKKKVILFLDEWGNSPAAIQAAFLTLLQDREFANGHKFPDETIVIGATNPLEEGADGQAMALPTTNRIFWISWNPTVQSWIDGMRTAWGKTVSEEEMKWKRKISSFIADNPSWLHKLPDDAPTTEAFGLNSNNASDMDVYRSAWPSRRSWDNLSRVLAAAPDDAYIQDSIAQGIVGYSATASFRDWLRKHDSISPADVLKDPSSVDWTTLGLNDTNMLLRSIVDMVDEANSEKAIAVFAHIADVGMGGNAGAFVSDLLRKVSSKEFRPEVRKANQALALDLAKKYKNISSKAMNPQR